MLAGCLAGLLAEWFDQFDSVLRFEQTEFEAQERSISAIKN